MRYPYTSSFPAAIDERSFFHDLDIPNKTQMEAYNTLISQKKYTEANILLSESADIHTFSADLFNFIEAKIKSFQDYTLKKEKYNPFHYSSSVPEGNTDLWIDN